MLAAEQAPNARIRVAASAYLLRWGGAASAGIRLVGRRVDAEFGAHVPFAGGGLAVTPMINIIYKFGS